MYTLPHQFEFLGDAWLAEARDFLQREVAGRKDRLAGPFSLSERFTDAPPHLQLPDDVAAWNLRYDGEALTVSRGADGDADLVVEGDYQAALTAAQRVGITAAWRRRGDVARAVPAVRQGRRPRPADSSPTPGRRAGRPCSTITSGRRTVENPDLHHRASRQGLARQHRRDGGAGLHRAGERRSRPSSPTRCARRRCGRCPTHGRLVAAMDALPGPRVRAAGASTLS